MSRYIIDKNKLIENINIIKEKAGVEVIGVVKGNGYGFGMANLAEILMQNGIKTFAVTEVYDIPLLRETVLVLHYILPPFYCYCSCNGFALVICHIKPCIISHFIKYLFKVFFRSC